MKSPILYCPDLSSGLDALVVLYQFGHNFELEDLAEGALLFKNRYSVSRNHITRSVFSPYFTLIDSDAANHYILNAQNFLVNSAYHLHRYLKMNGIKPDGVFRAPVVPVRGYQADNIIIDESPL